MAKDKITTERTPDDKIHAEAIERFESIEDREERKLAIEDMRFAHVPGAQWDEDSIEKRKNRPRFTINRIEPAIDQVTGDQRQNRTSIKVRPVSSGANEKTAKVFNGIIRNIQSLSKAENAYDAAFDESVTGGYGGWRILTEFNDDDSFEQDIKIKPINSAASSLYFGPSDEYDKRDADWAFVITDMPTHEFEDKWPGKSPDSFPAETLASSDNCWFGEDFVKVAEYWKKIPVKREIVLLSDGRVIDKTEDGAALDELALQGVTVMKTRSVDSHKVVMYVMNGNELLEPKQDWAGKFIPLIPVFGKIHHIEGRTYVKGLTRDAKDPSKIYNYTTSQAVEVTAMSPKDPIWMTAVQAAGHKESLAGFNTNNDPFMFYNSDPAAPGPPQRGGAPALQQSLLAQTAQAAEDIEATTGIPAPALGRAPQLLSQRSVESQAEKGDRGSFVYPDNLQKSIQYTGEILTDLIPKIMDTPRIVRILNIDGTSEQIEINQIMEDVVDQQTGETITVNNLTVGKYDVVTDTGPAFATKRVESAQQLIELASGSPVIQELGIDLIVANLDINDSEELTKRVRARMISQGTVQPTEDEIEELGLNQPQPPDPTQVALLENIQISTQKLISDIEKTEADTLSVQVKTQQETAKTVDIMVGTLLDKIKGGLPLSQQEIMLIIKQRDILAEGQQAIDPGPNSVQAADIVSNLITQ